MTTPSLNTPWYIVQDAYRDAGLIGQTDTPTSDQFVDGMRKLTDMILLWQVADGLKLWLNVDTPVPLTAGVNEYSFSPSGDIVMTRPFRVIQGYWLSAEDARTPLNVLSWDDWLRLSQVSGNTGALNSYFVDKRATELVVFFWLTPDATAATGTAHVLLQQQATQFTQVTDTMDFPIEWRIALRWGLADELATGQPQAIMDRCAARAATYREALSNWDVEDAPTRFAPDPQYLLQQGSRFQ